MPSLAKISKTLEDIESKIAQVRQKKFLCSFDKHNNFFISFKDGRTYRLPFIRFRPYQKDIHDQLFVKDKHKILLCWPRRSGKEFVSWSVILQEALINPGLYLLVYPTNVIAKSVLWEGGIIHNEGQFVPFLKMIPSQLIASINNQELKIKLVNGSIIWMMGSDINIDRLRGTNPRLIVFSEFAFQDPRVYQIMRPVLVQNKGKVILQSTFNGMNHFYQLYERVKNDPSWYCKIESITTLLDENGQRYITDEMIEQERKDGMPEYLIQQEYYGNVILNEETRYFALALKEIHESNRLIDNLIIPYAPLYTAWDLGKNDTNAIIFFQVKRVENYMRSYIVGYLENNNKGFSFYINEIRQFAARYSLPVRYHFLPHDGRNQIMTTDKPKSAADFLHEMGEVCITVQRPKEKILGIEAVRRRLYFCDFNKENTGRLIDCLSNYSKEFDDKMGRYKDNPIHDWASHGTDAFQTMAFALDAGMVGENKSNISYYNEHAAL